ncbi:MAG: stage III sporulation protein AG [Oscillospiraceae bacterium]
MKEKEALLSKGKKTLGVLGRYKYVLLVMLVGALLLLLPDSKKTEKSQVQAAVSGEEDFSVEALEEKLEEVLSEIDGAGQVQVVLTVQSGMKRVFAQDGSLEQDGSSVQRETQTVVVSAGSGTEETVLVQQIYPQFQGALVVAAGGGDPAVRLKLTEAVAALTGLGADKISICKGK